MSPDHPVDDEPLTTATEGGAVRAYSLAFVCVLGLMAGGAGAFALHHARQGPAEVTGAAEKSPDVGRGAATVESSAAEATRAEDAQTWAAGEEVNAETVASSGRAGRPA